MQGSAGESLDRACALIINGAIWILVQNYLSFIYKLYLNTDFVHASLSSIQC